MTDAAGRVLPLFTYVEPPSAASSFISKVPAAKLFDDSDDPFVFVVGSAERASESDWWKVTVRQPGDIYVEKRSVDHGHVSLHTPKRGLPSKEAHWKDHHGQTRADHILKWGWRFARPAFHLVFWPNRGTAKPPAPDDVMPDVCLITTNKVGVDVAIVVLEGHVDVDRMGFIDADRNEARVVPLCRRSRKIGTVIVCARWFRPERDLSELVAGAVISLAQGVTAPAPGEPRDLLLKGIDQDGVGFGIPAQVADGVVRP